MAYTVCRVDGIHRSSRCIGVDGSGNFGGFERMKQINEYKDYPKWIDTMTKERQYEWYLYAKKEVIRLRENGKNVDSLKDAISEYESRHQIK
jgi:hypothetical protein